MDPAASSEDANVTVSTNADKDDVKVKADDDHLADDEELADD